MSYHTVAVATGSGRSVAGAGCTDVADAAVVACSVGSRHLWSPRSDLLSGCHSNWHQGQSADSMWMGNNS